MIDKTFTPQTIEPSLYEEWLENNIFACDPTSEKPHYTMMMPPPNVTGALHIGHALNATLQDILARFKRQKGFDVLWQPGTDHAGIATQFVVERNLKAQGIHRTDLGREKFREKVWEWKEESGGTIVNQMQRLGISPDWKRARFTMDEGLSDAVRDVFVKLYRDGLIYKDTRLVNWDPSFQSAISDLEVFNRETKGKMYWIAYPLEENPDIKIIIATTRPETMFGDTAVAVHPEDPRYQHLIGKKLRQPLTGRLLPIIADEYCDKDFGSGAVKITPAHDFNDFAIGKRHTLEFVNILNPDGTLNDHVPEAFRGLLGDKARSATVTALEECGVLVKTEDHTLSIPYSEKSDARVEPYLTEQWFVAMDQLAERALKAVEDNHTTFFPKQWENTYFEWLKNIQPWCISRQIWWGHQIPAWYGPDGEIFIEKTQEEAEAAALKHYGAPTPLTQDTDVLDTWFSSALWPFSTLGWPEKTKELEKYYPTSVLITGFDIIFFWVARMMMIGLYTQDQIPFEKVYIHALVRDEKGQKMSKTRGNVLDPLELIEKYGADALRFTLAISAAPGRDIKIGASKVENYRNFLTKLYNAARFLLMQDGASDHAHTDFNPLAATLPLSKWIISHTSRLAQNVQDHLDNFRFDLAGQAIYHFVWGTYCDFFLEFMKPIMNGDDEKARTEILNTAFWSFAQMLKILQPFAPFITEHLWRAVGYKTLLCQENWPVFDANYHDKNAESTMNHLMDLITSIRRLRADYNVPPASFLKVSAGKSDACDGMPSLLVKRMARLDDINFDAHYSPKAGDILITLDGASYYLHLGDSIDILQEKARIQKDIEKLEKDRASSQARLNNADFIQKAKDDVIDEMKERVSAYTSDIAQKKKALIDLG